MINDNNYIEVVLTKQGAMVLNENRGADLFKDNDVFKCQIHEFLIEFGGPKYNICGPTKFKDIKLIPE